jgi:glycosyltransferase involved in cell wall biosynthesis
MYIFQMIDGLSIGGAQHLQVAFAKEANRRGFKLAVISLGEDIDSQYVKQLRSLGVAVYFFPTNRIFDFNNLYRITKLFLAERPDILHTHLTYSNIIGSMIARLTRIPIVATLHSTGIDERFRAPRTEKAEKFALRHLVNKIIACGPAVARHYQSNIKDEPVLVIPNAVEDAPQISFSERDDLRKQIVGDSDRPIIISVGRLVRLKGFEDLLDAFYILHSFHPDAFLAIVGGGGNIKNVLDQKIKVLNLAGHVGLLGWRTDVPELLLASDMFVLASHWEGLPIAILEAMAAGLPVLATDVGDNAWAIDLAGITVPPRQPEMLADAMKELLDDPARRRILGQVAKARIGDVFNPSIWFDKTISVYQKLLS